MEAGMRVLVLLFLAGAAVAQAPTPNAAPPGFRGKPVGTLKQVMRGILLPNSDAIFNVSQTPPKNDEQWAAIENSAIAIAEAASLINMPGRLRSDGKPVPMRRADWIKYSQGLVAAATASYKAIQSKNTDMIDMANDGLTEACDACHRVYRDVPQK
jgi:hypothetical protein